MVFQRVLMRSIKLYGVYFTCEYVLDGCRFHWYLTVATVVILAVAS